MKEIQKGYVCYVYFLREYMSIFIAITYIHFPYNNILDYIDENTPTYPLFKY